MILMTQCSLPYVAMIINAFISLFLVVQSLIIIGISAIVCVLTTLSLCAICTNGEVKGGKSLLPFLLPQICSHQREYCYKYVDLKCMCVYRNFRKIRCTDITRGLLWLPEENTLSLPKNYRNLQGYNNTRLSVVLMAVMTVS
jgi:hypothetical protein